MNYLTNLIIGCLIYHFTVCSIGSFAAWEFNYFNMDEWGPGTRFIYAVVFLVTCAVSIYRARPRY